MDNQCSEKVNRAIFWRKNIKLLKLHIVTTVEILISLSALSCKGIGVASFTSLKTLRGDENTGFLADFITVSYLCFHQQIVRNGNSVAFPFVKRLADGFL